MTDRLGGGFATDGDFDLIIDASGDIDFVNGFDEYKKDLAFNLTRALTDGDGVDSPAWATNGVFGVPFNDGALRDIEIVVTNVLNDDPRTESVSAVTVEAESPKNDGLVIDATVVVIGDGTEVSLNETITAS